MSGAGCQPVPPGNTEFGCNVETRAKQLLGLDIQQLTDMVEDFGQPPYRARQLFDAIYRRRVIQLEGVTPLPASFRKLLSDNGREVGAPDVERRFVSSDGTVRYLLSFRDGQSVETVWMPEGDQGEAGDGSEAGDEEQSREWRRATICVSSQVGCAVDCQFCMTALLGLQRNMQPGEIVGQIIAVLNDQRVEPGNDRINLVFMGQGEPFLNYENFMAAVRLLVEGVGLSPSRMTVSTAGIVPRIYDFGQERIRPKLAISLNASNDGLRDRLMPINRKWNLEKLMGAARDFPLRARERLTFEYVLLRDVNDAVQNAREVVELVRGIRCKVNLIALNPGPDIPFEMPEEQRVLAFQEILMGAGIAAFVRRPRGRDIYAACGQLRKAALKAP